jgi:hypothetical protein
MKIKNHSRIIFVAMASALAGAYVAMALRKGRRPTALKDNFLDGVAIGIIQINIEKG